MAKPLFTWQPGAGSVTDHTKRNKLDKNINFKVCCSAWWKVEALLHAQMDYSRRAHLLLSILPLDMPPLQGSRRGLITDSCPENCNRSRSKRNFLRHWLKYTHSRSLVASCSSETRCLAACYVLETLRCRGTSPCEWLSSPGASEASQARMGRLLDQRRDDALHHVRQHSEGRHHDEVDEPWRHTEGMSFISSRNEWLSDCCSFERW